jgi:hypothetical protein
MMTLQEARLVLSEKLVFGDSRQLEAVSYIERIEAIAGKVAEKCPNLKYCKVCRGEGEHDCDCGNAHDCEECDGTGWLGSDGLVDDYDSQLLRDALKMIDEKGKNFFLPHALASSIQGRA